MRVIGENLASAEPYVGSVPRRRNDPDVRRSILRLASSRVDRQNAAERSVVGRRRHGRFPERDRPNGTRSSAPLGNEVRGHQLAVVECFCPSPMARHPGARLVAVVPKSFEILREPSNSGDTFSRSFCRATIHSIPTTARTPRA
ncbi:hypothetical protein KM043_009476 [Ampulex compressa]|nr:hypothetical protein KM043_009476 [Ampulex compressa]